MTGEASASNDPAAVPGPAGEGVPQRALKRRDEDQVAAVIREHVLGSIRYLPPPAAPG